jgi:penicillin-binding protein 2
MYRRRVIVFMAIIATGMITISARLWQLQVVQGREYREQFEQRLRRVSMLPAMRGQILDRNGNILAMDHPAYDLCLDYRFLVAQDDWVRQQVRQISKDRGLPRQQAQELFDAQVRDTWTVVRSAATSSDDLDEAVDRVLRRVAAMRELVGSKVAEEEQFHPVLTGLDEQAAIELRMALTDRPGALVAPSRRRWYPAGDAACHVIGVVGQVSAREQQTLNLPPERPWLDRVLDNYLDSDWIGKSGVERMCEAQLRGRRGYLRQSPDDGQPQVAPATPGQDVRLTLDLELQRRVAAQFPAGVNGAAVVLSVRTGEVLAMVSAPTYDLNTYRRQYAALIADERDLPLNNRAVRRLYPPGSTAKPVTSLAALTDGKLTTASAVNCRGYLFSPESFRCWIWKNHAGHGPLDVTGALKNSCNIYFYHAGELLGGERLGQWMAALGWSAQPGTGLPEEAAGFVPTSQWLREREHRDFVPADGRFMGIGQGLVTVTPMHVASAMATIARGGKVLSPVLVAGRAQQSSDMGWRAADVAAVHRGMYEVANEVGGTAYKVFHGPDAPPVGVEVCGKTGTAQTPPQRVDTDGDGTADFSREGDMAWFAGFAPYRDPQIAFAVVLEYVEGGGARNAGPVARELVRACVELGYTR